MGYLGKPVLILNKSWVPIRVETVRKGLKYVFEEKAMIVDPVTYNVYTFDDWIKLPVGEDENHIITSGGNIRVPDVILLKGYNRVPNHKVRLSRKNLLIRDGYRDQYTGNVVSAKEATLDHVVPRSKGGKSTWTNLVIVSRDTNKRKADRTPAEAGMRLIRPPYEPKWNTFFVLYIKQVPEAWRNFIKAIKNDAFTKSNPVGQAF